MSAGSEPQAIFASTLSLIIPRWRNFTKRTLALANAEPELCIAAFAGDATAQRQLTPSHQATRQDFPHGMKELVAKRFGTPTATRLNLR